MERPEAERVRERRVILVGAAVVGAALVFTYGVLPFVRHWQAREAALAAAGERVAYLQDLTDRTSSLEEEAAALERALSAQGRRVLHARSSTLAASALQTFLQDAADASHLVVLRLEVAADDSARVTADNAPTQLPATLSAYGDIAGIAAMLDVVASGPRALSVERVSMLRNTALAGAPDVVQLTLTLRAPVLPQ